VPTYDRTERFKRDFEALGPEQREKFIAALNAFRQDLNRGTGFRRSLRVKGVRGAPGVFEMTWAWDGRATFSYGDSIKNGEAHIIWRRIGTHSIFNWP
jgi:hypothetical protein